MTGKFQKITIAGCIGLFLLLRIPSLFEPNWYGDEGIYQTVGLALGQGRTLYSDIWDNKPPLLFLLYMTAGGNQFAVRLMSVISGIAAIVAFSLLTEKLFTKHIARYGATAVFSIVFGLPLLEGNIANAENFMLFPTCLAMALVISGKKPQQVYLGVGAGILLGVSFLLKTVAFFDIFAVFCFLFFIGESKRSIRVLLGFALPVCSAAVYFIHAGTLMSFMESVLTQNIGYVDYGNYFLIPKGLLIAKAFLLLLVLVIVFRKRHAMSRSFLFILLWVMWSVFSVYFSGRGYTHYVLLLLPSYALLFGYAIESLKRIVPLSVCIALGILMSLHFQLFWNSWGYYENFLLYSAHEISHDAYLAFFDPVTVRNYRIAAFLNERIARQDRIFVWGNSAQIYVMTNTLPPGKYVVAYHSIQTKQTVRQTQEALENVKPRFIILLPDPQAFPYSLEGYGEIFSISGARIYEKKAPQSV